MEHEIRPENAIGLRPETPPTRNVQPVETGAALSKRITVYLAGGGLFNPEMAIHDRVRNLLIDCRNFIDSRGQDAKN